MRVSRLDHLVLTVGSRRWHGDRGPGTFQLAVTGGTGRYQDARGYATVVPGQNPKVTLHLTS